MEYITKTKEINIVETFNEIDFDYFHQLIEPKNDTIQAYIVRGFYNKAVCEEIKNGFYKALGYTKGGTRHDHVPVNQIGATQFTKNSVDYFNECKETEMLVKIIIDSCEINDVKNDFLQESEIKEYFRNKGITFRSSQFNNEICNLFTARKWINNQDGLLLLPHEDLSQLRKAKEDNYEICKVSKVIASNLCVSNSEIGGELILWNYIPDDDIKLKLGVTDNGYPYPFDLISEYKSAELKVEPGDLYFINANLVHGVRETGIGERITLGRFLGFINDKEIVYWT